MLSSLVSLFHSSLSLSLSSLGKSQYGETWYTWEYMDTCNNATGNREKATTILCQVHAMHRGVESMVGTFVGNSSGENTRTSSYIN